MKTTIKYIILFSMFFCFKSIAQRPGDSKPLSDNTTFKGRYELWKEKKVQRNEKRKDKKTARKARRKNVSKEMPKREVRGKKEQKEKNKKKNNGAN